MPKLAVGGKMPDFVFDTPFEAKRTLAETVKRVNGKSAVVFLRYFGCTLCQYDMHQYASEYDKIKATGGQLLVVLQSDPKGLASELTADAFPFVIICDPDQTLYQNFEISPAKSKIGLADPATMAKVAKVTLSGFKHGKYEGEELQLPASFVVTSDLTITYAHYSKVAGDVPTPTELAELLK